MREPQAEKTESTTGSLSSSKRQQVGEPALAPQFDPLERLFMSARGGSVAAIHASALNRATGSQSGAGRSLLQLQRSFGNHHVQRVLALARQGEGEAEVGTEIEAAIERARGGGQALDAGVRLQMESAFGTEFSGVRVHTDSEADSLNQAVGAVAFTTGNDIFFRQGSYSPGSSAGRELLAHELTHVVQQGSAPAATGQARRAPIQRLCPACEEEKNQRVQRTLIVGQPDDQYEQEADRVAMAVVSSLNDTNTSPGQASGSSTSAIQRQDDGDGGDGGGPSPVPAAAPVAAPQSDWAQFTNCMQIQFNLDMEAWDVMLWQPLKDLYAWWTRQSDAVKAIAQGLVPIGVSGITVIIAKMAGIAAADLAGTFAALLVGVLAGLALGTFMDMVGRCLYQLATQ